MSISELSVYNINHHSTIEQLMELIKKMNETVSLINDLDKSRLVCDFDMITGELRIMPNWELLLEEKEQDNELWKGKY